MGVRISVFAPYLCNTSASGLDVYAGGCLFEKGADWYPFCLGGGTGRAVWGVGVPQGCPNVLSKKKLPYDMTYCTAAFESRQHQWVLLYPLVRCCMLQLRETLHDARECE